MITFWYKISDIIDRAQIETLLFVKSVANKETGIPELDEYAIADEDESYVKKLLKDIANDVYSKLSPYSRELEDLDTPLEGFEFDVTLADPETPNCIIFRIIEPTNFDNVVTSPLENSIENALINHVASEFLFRNNGDGSLLRDRCDKNKGEILDYLSRRTKLKRTYKLY